VKLLAGDVGGTHTRLAVFTSESGPRAALFQKGYSNSEYQSFEEVVKGFLVEADTQVDGGCIGVGGPVVSGRVSFTNLDWVIDAEDLRSAFAWSSFTLLNDMEALAYGVTVLESDQLHTLSAGKPVPGGPIAILALGTGLGEGYLTHDGQRYRAHGCEGGHTSFGPVGGPQIGLLHYMNGQGYDHVSYERVCSGSLGVPNMYEYLKQTGLEEPDWLAERLEDADDPTPVIMEAALDERRGCELAGRTLGMLVEILGAEAGNLALKILATGGVYVGGGMSQHILPKLKNPAFLEAMRSKGRFRELVTSMPVHVILDPHAGLWGAAVRGLEG